MRSPYWLAVITAISLVGESSAFAIPVRKPLGPDFLPERPPIANGIGMKFVWVRPGSFLMGVSANEAGNQENPDQRKVTLTKGVYMSVFPVTQEQWIAIMGNNPSKFAGERDLPVDSVSWDDCQEFVKKLQLLDKKPYRLPTEAEWEYACRAGTATAYYFGADQNALGQHAWYGENSERRTHPVGQKKPNAWGLHDMHGNVFQWCQDWIAPYPQQDAVDPQGPAKGYGRVLRGGSWGHAPYQCGSAFRAWNEPGNRSSDFGLRVCYGLD